MKRLNHGKENGPTVSTHSGTSESNSSKNSIHGRADWALERQRNERNERRQRRGKERLKGREEGRKKARNEKENLKALAEN